MQTEILQLAAQIVSAYVLRNAVPGDELPGLIMSVSGTLAKAATPVGDAAVGEPSPTTAKPLPLGLKPEDLVQPDTVVCGICGFRGSVLKRHITAEHDMTPEQYREAVGLAADAPLVARNYAARRSEMAKKNGLGRQHRAWRS